MLTTIYAEGGKHHNSWPAQETHGEQTICNIHGMVQCTYKIRRTMSIRVDQDPTFERECMMGTGIPVQRP